MSEDEGLERVNYYSGQFLTTDDFTAEQNYFLGRQRRHNRHLHGWGVVTGLAVEQGDAGTITVSPGVAVDCYGNEISLDESTKLQIPKDPGWYYITVRYTETPVKPVPCIPDPCGEGEAQEFSRIREGCRVEITEADPDSGHDGMGPGTPGCGQQHPVTIASLKKVGRRWKVSAMGRR